MQYLKYNIVKTMLKRIISLCWVPPPQNFVKLNTDTDGYAEKNPSLGGAGGVFRNNHGDWILDFEVKLTHTTNTLTELVAIRTGLYLAKQASNSKSPI